MAEVFKKNAHKISKKDMPVSEWSGGTTTEIFIYPPDAAYKDRDFLFRISTASVELESSDFTDLPDYDRIIASIDGTMELTHGGSGASFTVRPLESVHYFDGGVPTHCEGKATDLNLMLRKGMVSGSLRFVQAEESTTCRLLAGDTAVVYDIASGTAYVSEAPSPGVLLFDPDNVCALFIIRRLTDRIG